MRCTFRLHGHRACERFLYTRRKCVLSGMHPVIIALHRVDAFMRCIQRYYVGTDHVIYNAARTGGLRGGVSSKDGAHLRTDRSLNCFVASSRRNSPVLYFSSWPVQVSTCNVAEGRFYRAYSAHRVFHADPRFSFDFESPACPRFDKSARLPVQDFFFPPFFGSTEKRNSTAAEEKRKRDVRAFFTAGCQRRVIKGRISFTRCSKIVNKLQVNIEPLKDACITVRCLARCKLVVVFRA